LKHKLGASRRAIQAVLHQKLRYFRSNFLLAYANAIELEAAIGRIGIWIKKDILVKDMKIFMLQALIHRNEIRESGLSEINS
jgi:hypothetical protein